MKREVFIKKLCSGKPLVADGAMGTLLHERGVSFENCFDELNLTNPALVGSVHQEYIRAGAEIILTNTFGANRYKLERCGLEELLDEINQTGVDLARRTISAAFKENVMIAGDVGPLGVRLAPFGRVQVEQAREVFREQIQSLHSANCDLIVIETMTDLYEIREAILAAREVDEDIPLVASMTFTRDDRTLLGDDPQKVASKLFAYGADVIGINCSGGPNQLLRILKKMKKEIPDSVFWVKPNAGWPEQVSGRIFYPASAEYFGEYALAFWQAGARVIGGCCGTTPAHIQSIRQAIDSHSVQNITNGITLEISEEEIIEEEISEPTRFAKKLAAGDFVFSVEMQPPRGLATKKIIAGASLLVDSGADAINVADSPMARMRMSPWAVCNLIQDKVNVETILHFPTRGRNLLRVQGDLLAAHALGVRNVFVIMGDPTAIGDYPEAMDNFDLAPSGLVKLIKQRFNLGIDQAGSDIGQPTSFFVGCALNLQPNVPQREWEILKRKINNGADFVITQPVFEAKNIPRFRQAFKDFYEELKIPLIAGILPLVSARHAAFLHQEVPGISIPDPIQQRMRIAEDNGSGPQEGMRIASELIRQVKNLAQGAYLTPSFGHYDYVAEIIDNTR
ncbi:MAG: bifunctional homocysteine S-methyltransferase/methylenetetrahydrofolate reductase [Chloroflexi bacterium]|nr:bifunctional homocysteine S-methyltransferase/methylenetetrahydrofolate reductase [Chloroflexota bacterium]